MLMSRPGCGGRQPIACGLGSGPPPEIIRPMGRGWRGNVVVTPWLDHPLPRAHAPKASVFTGGFASPQGLKEDHQGHGIPGLISSNLASGSGRWMPVKVGQLAVKRCTPASAQKSSQACPSSSLVSEMLALTWSQHWGVIHNSSCLLTAGPSGDHSIHLPMETELQGGVYGERIWLCWYSLNCLALPENQTQGAGGKGSWLPWSPFFWFDSLLVWQLASSKLEEGAGRGETWVSWSPPSLAWLS